MCALATAHFVLCLLGAARPVDVPFATLLPNELD